jgi:phosphoenolpyruvate-protein phosphotransferase (PTS system enzyme I)
MRAEVAQLAYRGRTASAGFAYGPFVRLDATTNGKRTTGTVQEETAAIRAALETAERQLAALANAAGGEAAQILEFQIALLTDDDFLEPVFAAIEAGRPADIAWSTALELQIEDYNSAPDEYLRARSSDIADLRGRVLLRLKGRESTAPDLPSGAVVCADDLPPSRFLEIDWSEGGGLALQRGSATSHVALLARARGIPMIVQLGSVAGGARTAILDGERGSLELDPGPQQIDSFERRRDAHRKSRAAAHAILRAPAASFDGEKIRLMINIQRVEDLNHGNAQFADGVGLMRTEFLLGGQLGLPSEETQYAAYLAVLRWAGDRPVTIRTFDAGGDKLVPGFTESGEANPFLGVRGLRLCLARPEIFIVQLRALARAAMHGNLKVMFPMVTTPDELEAGRQLLRKAVADLQADGVAARSPDLGIMVEVPAAALTVDRFNASFFSIGSNDLTQYVMASDRSNGKLGKLSDPLNPAVIELIRRTVQYGGRSGLSVSLCGDMAGDPHCLPALLSCGLRELSVNPSALAEVKQTIATLSGEAGRE